MTDLVQRLEETASVRRNATADDKDRYLSVVARLSREDADLMQEAAAAIIALQGERDHWKAQAANDAASAAIWQDRAEAAEAEVARLKDELAEAHRVIERLESYIRSPVRMSRDEDEQARRDDLVAEARSFRDGQKTGEKG